MQLGFPEMLFIFVLALIIFGPKKLPEIGRQIGKALAEFKRASNEFKYQLDTEIRQLESETKPAGSDDSAAAGIGRAVAELQRLGGEVKSRFESGLRDLEAETIAPPSPSPPPTGIERQSVTAPEAVSSEPTPPARGADA